MVDKDAPADGSGPDEVHVTMVVEPGRLRTFLGARRPGGRLRTVLVSVALATAVVAGAIVVVSLSRGRQVHPAGNFSPGLPASDRVAREFGVHVNCPRLTLVSPDRAYARIDFEPTAACGNYGNHVTLVLRHTRRAWLPAFEASGWTCPLRALPQSVVTELELCTRARVASRRVSPLNVASIHRLPDWTSEQPPW